MPKSPKAGGAVIEPRSFTDVRKKFGATSSRLSGDEIASPQQGAAEIQHALSNTIREHLLESGQDLKAFCASTELPAGLNFERFYRISNGTTMMGLTDIAFWANQIPDFARILQVAVTRVVDAGSEPRR